MSGTPAFNDVMRGLVEGDRDAAAEVHRRFVRRLVALAQRQFEPWVRAKADHEGVVQSVFKSFFSRCERGEFALDDWDDLWRLLAVITVRKCRRRRSALRAGRRDAAREIGIPKAGDSRDAACDWEVLDREPTPAEAAMLTEMLQTWLAEMGAGERAITELGLQGCSTPEIAERLGRTERTVRRIHQSARERLHSLLDGEPA